MRNPGPGSGGHLGGAGRGGSHQAAATRGLTGPTPCYTPDALLQGHRLQDACGWPGGYCAAWPQPVAPGDTAAAGRNRYGSETTTIASNSLRRVRTRLGHRGRSPSRFPRRWRNGLTTPPGARAARGANCCEERDWRRLLHYGEARAEELGISSDDVADLVEEHRADADLAYSASPRSRMTGAVGRSPSGRPPERH